MADEQRDPELQAQPDAKSEAKKSNTHPFWDFWGPVLFTVALYLGIRHYVAEARFIPSGSMLPGLQIQDRLLVEKLTYRRRSPRRGEIVVFHSPYAFDPVLKSNASPSGLRCALANLPLVGLIPGVGDVACDAYIKRVVAVAGDQVVVNPRGQVSVNGEAVSEPYVSHDCPLDEQGMSRCRTLNVTVPKGHVLVLGDNRRNSWDGRYWPGGPFLPEKEILGRAVWRFWPLNRTGSLGS
ncbi:signal peptidase I [Synechococcus sp. HK01-R]|uniref:signal peptidase I n=1 Tax=Synechococcus sp. HK01-R TaxID=2751171 RepID=UPI001628B67A|nr:signal peptidase I [Synechococcus sp. HK01-R]